MKSIAILFACCVAALGQPDPTKGPPPPAPRMHKVADGTYAIENANANMAELIYWGGNATAYVTGAGVILVDSKFARAHDDLVAKIKSVTDQPIKYVILTHNHGDHAAGAEQLEREGATVIISADDRENLARTPNQSWTPAIGYIGRMKIVLGGKEVDLIQMRGHTRGDTVVYIPASRVVCAGDLVTTADSIPSIVNYADGGSWSDWQRSIDEILKLDFDYAVPGHGPTVTKQELTAYRNKKVAMLDRFRAMNRDHKSQDEITQTLIREFNWGAGPSAGNIPGMMQELR
jgi:cyclase